MQASSDSQVNLEQPSATIELSEKTKALSINWPRIYWLESRLEVLRMLRSPGFTLPSLMFPVMFYFVFGVFFAKSAASMPTYMLVTYGTFGVIGPALFAFGVGIAVERGQGWLDLKEVSPMPASAYLLARIAVSLVFSAAIITLLFSVAIIFGKVSLMPMQWFLLAITLMLGSLPFCAFGLTLGLYLKSNSAPAVVNLLYLPMSFLSGLWIPISVFPEVMQLMANFLPPYHLAQIALKVIDMDLGKNIWYHLIVMTLFFISFLLLAAKAYYRKDKK